MTAEFIRKIIELDEAAERAGGYVALPTAESNKIGYDYPALSRYCKERGIKPASLSEGELLRFRSR